MKLVRGCIGLDAPFLSLSTARAITHKLAVGLFGCIVLTAICSEFLTSTSQLSAQEAVPSEYTEDEQRQIELAERFLGILEKNPRRGTALDRVYGHHIEFGTLDPFVEDLRRRTQLRPDDGASWMLLGLFESQRGKDVEAVEPFTKAEQLRPEDAMAAYYLSQSLLRIGENQKAVEAMERAIACNPPRTDLLEIYQQLGRVHQRAQRTDKALEVWNRLEELFPGDTRVLEQIAVTLVDEGQLEQATVRYQQLAESEPDPYRKATYRIKVAELKIQTKNRKQGLADFESILADLNPEGWLFRDVRRRIEDVFLNSGDQDSLVEYYEGWIDQHPEDVEAMTRLAKFLFGSARVIEATAWMEKALKLAPTRSDLRKSFIDQLVEQREFSEASKQYEILCDAEPSNVDFLKAWGTLVLRDRSEGPEAGHAEATRIWNQILTEHPEDASLTSQVADLFRHAGLKERAFELYQKAIVLSPNESRYREYLGEYYYLEGQSEKALDTWAAIAAPPNRSAESLSRLAEVYNKFGYMALAIESLVAATELEPTEFVLQIRLADYCFKSERYDDVLKVIEAAQTLASNDEQRELLVRRRIEVLLVSGRLDSEIDRQRLRIDQLTEPTISDWQLLARYLEAKADWPNAMNAIEEALQIDTKSIPILSTAARIAEASGDLGQAAEIGRQLAEVDRRARAEHLMNVARLEAQLGRSDEAMKAADALIILAPGNTDNYEFYANLCFRLNRREDALNALRKAMRINPNEPRLTVALAAALADDFENHEAIELYWRAFEKSDVLDDRTLLITKLVPLYEQLSQFDQLVARLEQQRREDDQRWMMTVCLAQAYQSVNDLAAARKELESLLGEETRNTDLLQQLAKLCLSCGDAEAAIAYQKQLAAIAPGYETEHPLALMLKQGGFEDEANEILLRLTAEQDDPIRLLQTLDALLASGSEKPVLDLLLPLMTDQQTDWELIYRAGLACAKLNDYAKAKSIFLKLLSIDLPHDSLGKVGEDELKRAQQQTRLQTQFGTTTGIPVRKSPTEMLAKVRQVLETTDQSPYSYDASIYANSPQSLWIPTNFAAARMAAYAWLQRIERGKALFELDTVSGRFLQQNQPIAANDVPIADIVRAVANEEDSRREDLYDWMYVAALNQQQADLLEIATRLAIDGNTEDKHFFMQQLAIHCSTIVQTPDGLTQYNGEMPLSDQQLRAMLQIYEDLKEAETSDSQSAIISGQVIDTSTGVPSIYYGNGYSTLGPNLQADYYTPIVIRELRLAGWHERADEVLDKVCSVAQSAPQLAGIITMMIDKAMYDRVDQYFTKWTIAAKQSLQESSKAELGAANSDRLVNNLLNSRNLNAIQRWFGHLSNERQLETLLDRADAILDVCIEDLLKRGNDSDHSALSSARQSSQNLSYMSVYHGSVQNVQMLSYALPDSLVDAPMATLLGQLHFSFGQYKSTDLLIEHFRTRLQKAAGKKVNHEKAMLAAVLLWSGNEEEAIDLLIELVHETQDNSFKLNLADIQLRRNRTQDALVTLNSIVTTDPSLIRQRELMALQVAEETNDIPRARQAAERLFGLRMGAEGEMKLLPSLKRLGMNEMARAIMARLDRDHSNSLATLANLMTMYAEQDSMDQAVEAAIAILSRTKSPAVAMASFSSSLRASASAKDGEQARKSALGVLKKSGKLKQMIAEMEQRIEQYPHALPAYELLAEYYEVDGRIKDSLAVLEKATQISPKAYNLKLRLAKIYEARGKIDEACNHYRDMFQAKPDLALDNLNKYLQIFQRAYRLDEFLELIEEANLAKLRQSQQISLLVFDLTEAGGENLSEPRISLLERIYQEFPEQRTELLERIAEPKWVVSDRLFDLIRKELIPGDSEINSNPWAGLLDVRDTAKKGEVGLFFHIMASELKGSSRYQELRERIQAIVEVRKDWIGGHIMLALLDTESSDEAVVNVGRQSLVKLCSDQQVIQSVPYGTCWSLAQIVADIPDQDSLAIRLYEAAVESNDVRGLSGFVYTPIPKLVALYKASGRREEAKKLILSRLNFENGNVKSLILGSTLRGSMQDAFWAAEQMAELAYPASAIRIYQDILETDPSQVPWLFGGSSGRNHVLEAQNGIDEAIKNLKAENVSEAIDELFAAKETEDVFGESLAFPLEYPSLYESSSNKITSRRLDTLLKLIKNEAGATALDRKFDRLCEERPDDLSILVLNALLKLLTGSDRAHQSLQMITDWIDANPVDVNLRGEGWGIEQRVLAEQQIKLWLVARELVGTAHWKEFGEPFARRAADAAGLQFAKEPSLAVLYEWVSLLAKSGEPPNENLWLELLGIATQRSRSFSQRDSHGTEQRLFPLTLSQFGFVTKIAEQAALAGLPSVSQIALKESLAGGYPVLDPEPENLTSRQVWSSNGRRIVPFTLRQKVASQRASMISIESEVLTGISRVLKQWQGSDFNNESAMMTIHSFVFPDNAANSIHLYSDSKDLGNARIRSLGQKLVMLAAECDKLDWLQEQIQAREKAPGNELPAIVLRINIALVENDQATILELLTQLESKVDTLSSLEDIKLTCHAAIPAAEYEIYKPKAISILSKTIKLLDDAEAGTPNAAIRYTSSSLGRIVKKYYSQKGSEEELRQQFEDRLHALNAEFRSHTGEFATYRRWVELCAIANEAATLNASGLAIEYMGHAADIRVDRYSRPKLVPALIASVSSTRSLKPIEAYDKWKAWTFSNEKRSNYIRFAAEWIEEAAAPVGFAKLSSDRKVVDSAQPVSTLGELVKCAAACGKLDELRSLTQKACEENVIGAQHLSVLVKLAEATSSATSEVEIAIEELLKWELPRKQTTESLRDLLALVEAEIFLQCLDKNVFFGGSVENFWKLEQRLNTNSSTEIIGLLRARMLAHVCRLQAVEAPTSQQQSLKHWLAFRGSPPQINSLPGRWLGSGETATLISGRGNEYLAFEYPLVGEFEFTVDCFFDDHDGSNAGYGGVVVNAHRWGELLTIVPISQHEEVVRKKSLQTDLYSNGQFKVASDGKKMQINFNGYKIYEEELGHTSPWLLLSSQGARVTRFSNPRFTGNPIIPRSVDLIAGDRMDGWSCSVFAQKQPRLRLAEQANRTASASGRDNPQKTSMEFYHWRAENGVLVGESSESDAQGQRWIYYQRPLQDRETVSYEYFYTPNVETVAATLGQLAVIIEPTGVYCHWITADATERWLTGVEENNRKLEILYRRGKTLPLKEKDWNAISLTRKGQNFELRLNDQLVFERPLDDLGDGRFGLFHYGSTRAKVRNIKLSGNWPEDFRDAIAGGGFQPNSHLSPEQESIVQLLIPRELDQPSVRDVVKVAGEMNPEDAISVLRRWVLPSSPGGRIRMDYVFLSSQEQLQLEPRSAGLDRIVSPALELVRICKETERLDELLSSIEQLDPRTDVDARNQQALRILVLMQQNNDKCRPELGKLYESLTDGLSKELSVTERTAEYLVAVEAGRSEQYWTAGYDILHRLRSVERDGANASGQWPWKIAVNSAMGAIELRWLGKEIETPQQWTSVPLWNPRDHVNGKSPSTWVVDQGSASHFPGESSSQLFFQSPLRGEYEISASKSTYRDRDVWIASGMHAAEPRADLLGIQVSTLMQRSEIFSKKLSLPVWDSTADFRIVVNDSSVKTFVNGVQIHEERFATSRDPWLVLQATNADQYCTVRDLRITGNPIIPEEIDLIDNHSWASWRFDVYDDRASQRASDQASYNRVDNMIVGNLRTDRTGSPIESLMMYARPMLEDGEIEFETFYKAGEYEVHPTIGRVAFMLDQATATVHHLTNAQWDRSGTAKDNRGAIEVANGELKWIEDDWNRVKLRLEGDRVTIFLNSSEVATHTISEPKQMRFFGLFRYSDLSRCRVRNLKYRGDWPKSVPTVDQQELAYPNEGPYAFADSEGVSSRIYEFSEAIAQIEAEGFKILGDASEVAIVDGELKVGLVGGGVPKESAGVELQRSIDGDCELTVNYSNLEIAPVSEGGEAGFAMEVFFDDVADTAVSLALARNSAGKEVTQAEIRRKMPDEQFSTLESESVTGHNASGRLRMVRQGGRLHCLVAEGDSETFRLIHSFTVGPAKIRAVSLLATSSDSQGVVSAVLSDLHVKEILRD